VTVIVRVFVADALGEPLSKARTVKDQTPARFGFPEIVPLEPRLRPGGRIPEARLHVYGGTPPVAASVWLYDVRALPLAREEVVMETGDDET
jgi:hypothetical protein